MLAKRCDLTSQNRHGPHSKFENLRSNQLLFLVASQFKNLPRMNRESIVHIQIRRCGRWKLRYLNQYKIFECLLNGTLNQICFFLLLFPLVSAQLAAGRVPGLPIRDCTASCNSSKHGQTTVSTIVVTARTFFERLYMVPGLSPFDPRVKCPCVPTPPPFAEQLFLDFCENIFPNCPSIFKKKYDSVQGTESLVSKKAPFDPTSYGL